MKHSLKLAVRVLARRKIFTAISLAGIVLTLVVLMVATAVLDNELSARAPESRLDRMLFATGVREHGPDSTMQTNPGYGFTERTLVNLPGAELVTLTTEFQTVAIYGRRQRLDVVLRRVDANFWKIFDLHFIEGAPFTTADADADRSVIIITDKLRDKVFGSGQATGKTVVVGDRAYRVGAVVSAVSVSHILGPYAEAWVPPGPISASDRKAIHGNLIAVVLARSESDIKPMQREYEARVARIPVSDPKQFKVMTSALDTRFESVARGVHNGNPGDHGPAILRAILAGLALLFMTLPALNLVTLNLSRILERAPEIGVRKAFGASRGALIGQFVGENVLLTLIGGAISFVLTFLALRVIEASDLIPDAHFDIDFRIFAYGMFIAAFFGVFSGLYPAWRMARLNPVNALRGGGL